MSHVAFTLTITFLQQKKRYMVVKSRDIHDISQRALLSKDTGDEDKDEVDVM